MKYLDYIKLERVQEIEKRKKEKESMVKGKRPIS